ncbi:hypothetical protein TWF102_002749 [Orbilia oligospora]|uniref:GLEYA adhesin domain-containing protein n=1 Tax=Orbilia oligospora TaxID=2813651 RepID=A0A7C8NGH9_ORBOL|nr:hypothetical protein TWF102_002749 [Orbilia oligospora]
MISTSCLFAFYSAHIIFSICINLEFPIIKLTMVSIKISTISTTLTIAISSRFPTRTKTVVGTRTTVVGTTETSLLRTVVLATVMVETTVTRTPTTTLTFATTSYETGAPPLVTFKKLAQRATISPICSCFLTSTFANELVEDHNYRVSHCNTHKRRHGYLEKHIFFFLHSDFDGINHGNSSDNRRATLTTVIITPSPLPDTSCGNSGVNVWLYNSPFSSGTPNTDFEPSVLTNLAPYGTTITHMIGFSSAIGSHLHSLTVKSSTNQYVIDYHGCMYLPKTTNYIFELSDVDDIACLWVRSHAKSGYTRRNANICAEYDYAPLGGGTGV